MEPILEPPVPQDEIPDSEPTPLAFGQPYAEIDLVAAIEFEDDPSEILLVPPEYDRETQNEDDQWRDEYETERCWKTTIVYQQIEPHPRIVPFVRADEWSGLPVLAKPTGPHLVKFLTANADALYEARPNGTDGHRTAERRVRQDYLPLFYKWSLQFCNAVRYAHSYSDAPLQLVLGDPKLENCFLSSPSMDLSFMGFLDAAFGVPPERYSAGCSMMQPFHPQFKKATVQSDIFLVGCVLYHLMTNHWPGKGQGLSFDEEDTLVPEKRWPELEDHYLGAIVRKCWTAEITTAAQLMLDLGDVVTGLGCAVHGEDEIDDLDVETLLADLEV